jgi:glycine cleavage system H lipoate-binding protein
VVVLPRVGSFIGQKDCFAYIIQEDYILPVTAPLSGTIQAVNPRLKKEPALITDDPKEEGWLMMIKPDNLENELKNLLFGSKAFVWYKNEENIIITRVDQILKHDSQTIGPTLQDGGVRIDCMHDLLNNVTSQQKARVLEYLVTRPKKLQGNRS